MLKFISVILSIFAASIQLNVATRISEKKCAEYSQVPRSSDPKMYGHMVWITIKKESGTVDELGTLISEMFVLTTALSTYDLILVRSKVHFSNTEQYNVIEKYIHPSFNRSLPYAHNIGLLRMETEIELDSKHRPACLWTKNYFESVRVEHFKTCLCDIHYHSLPYKLVFGNNCTWAESNDYPSLFCAEPLNDQDRISTRGSPIAVYRPKENLPDNYFIYGTVSFIIDYVDPIIEVGIKINDYINWIESIVWPTQTTINNNCGRIKINFRPFITFSAPTFHGEFPWHAAIFISMGLGERKYICGGSLLNENTVLTAAHCVSYASGIVAPQLLIVALGAYDLGTATLVSRESYVDRVMSHENFNRNYLENDIAILKLKTNIEFSNFIQPVCISNDSNIFTDTLGVTPGWGRNEQDTAENILTKASFPVLTDTECRNSNRDAFPALLNDKNFCAGYGNGTGVCTGDSGGGLIVQHDGQSFIRGIVSLGLSLPDQSRCDSSQPAVFTDVVKFYDWIINKLL